MSVDMLNIGGEGENILQRRVNGDDSIDESQI